MIVLDASAAADAVATRADRGAWAAETMRRAGELHAPHLLDYEVASTLRRLVLAAALSPRRGQHALASFERLPLTRYPARPLLRRIWQLRNNLTAYDAAYVALAEALGLPLVTTDARLARTRGHRAEIVAYEAA